VNIRAQVSMVFHLDKCIGCHTCSLACKNIWTARRGTEYMWWNNVETKPGTGYPVLYEDQDKYRGGWEVHKGKPRLRLWGRVEGLANIFFNPYMPSIDDYYEPFTYRYRDLFGPVSEQPPVARPISMITGKRMDVEMGPNWDDDLSGSSLYASNDPNLKGLTEEDRGRFFEFERLAFFYLPRICNHCLNPGCVAACPAGAIYKRGEDGIVLVSQDKCRGWRMCMSGCPYKKVYYNWETGKSEKCILCFPRQEVGQAPACFHSCVGRIRYLGILLYDADLIEESASVPDNQLVDAQRDIILDPFDETIARKAEDDGVDPKVIEAARRSLVYTFVKQWRIALPLHPEFRTLPMLFYVPPFLPVPFVCKDNQHDVVDDFYSGVDRHRLPIHYLALILSAGDDDAVLGIYRKLYALRIYMRSSTVGDIKESELSKVLTEAATNPEELEAIYRLSALAGFYERHVIPPFMREEAVGAITEPDTYKAEEGTGYTRKPQRGW
jgi:nitrate reductase / nitrite oxidoreductase, beta subunit